MSRIAAPPEADRTRVTRSPAAHLGATLRSVVVAPRAGFESSLRAISRRRRTGSRPGEGTTPYVLSAIGGAALMLLWLKTSSLIGLREDSARIYDWVFIPASCAVGAAIGTLAQLLWGYVAPHVTKLLGAEIDPAAARLVWGASCVPQVAAVAILLPGDLLIAGSDTFTSAKLPDPVASIWASLSIALALALAVWSASLFALGLQVSTKMRLRDAVIASGAALASLAVIVILLALVAALVAGGGGG